MSSLTEFRFAWNAMYRPSGDHVGYVSADTNESVSLVTLPPSLVITKSSACRPMRSLENTMRSPSGDHVGASSDEGSFVRLRRPEPSGFITQMSLLPLRRDWNT